MIAMVSHIRITGPAKYQLRSAAELGQSALEVTARRLCKGPLRPRWNWFMEVVTRTLQKQVNTAMQMRDVREARAYLDSIVITSPALAEVAIRPAALEKFSGSWFCPRRADTSVNILYFHGGGYSFYPQAYAGVIAQFAVAANCRAFALDYRLTPEHRFPAQLEDALSAYSWLLGEGIEPANLVVAGDSAGGHLALALVLKLRDLRLPQPALVIVLSPPTNFEIGALVKNEFDWINEPALLQWRDWFCGPSQRCDPLVSPIRADLRDLPPIYIQTGRAEILYGSIRAFADRARSQGADVTLESWDDMNHNFPVFGPDVPQSIEALRRIGEVIEAQVRAGKKEPIALTEPR